MAPDPEFDAAYPEQAADEEDARRVARFVGSLLLAGFVLIAAGIYYVGWYVLDPRTTDRTALILLGALALAMVVVTWLLVSASRRG